MTELCTKCRKCGLPRKGHFDRKSRRDKRRLIGQPAEYPVATYQLAAVAIQTVIRSFLIQLKRRGNVPVAQWRRQCVHFLSTKGPYGRCSQLNVHRRLVVYIVAATEIQAAWRNYRWLRHLQLVVPDAQQRNAIVLQRSYRASVCRRFYSILLHLMRDPASSKLRELIEQDTGAQNAAMCRLGISSFPFALYYRMEGIENWNQANAGRLLGYMREQVKLQRVSAQRRNTANLQSPSMRRRSKKEAVDEQRRERVRRASRRKFKWFYERQERSEEQPDEPQTEPEGTPPDDSEIDVLAWLEGVDFDAVDNL